jgi:hypothetical protein
LLVFESQFLPGFFEFGKIHRLFDRFLLQLARLLVDAVMAREPLLLQTQVQVVPIRREEIFALRRRLVLNPVATIRSTRLIGEMSHDSL